VPVLLGCSSTKTAVGKVEDDEEEVEADTLRDTGVVKGIAVKG
jgi:hypothetical protein